MGRVERTDADLLEAFAAAGVAEVDASLRRRAEYSSDASLYRVPPRLVVLPRDADEVLAAISVCRDLGVPMTPRSGGTSIAGNAISEGVVVDTSRHMTAVLDLDPGTRTARVQPGVILDSLQSVARPFGLRFGPDPSTHDRCTLGGMIGNNACGSRALAYGRTVDNVREMRFALPTGGAEVVRGGLRPEGGDLHRRLTEVVEVHQRTIRAEVGLFSRQGSGYGLHHLLPEHGGHVARALVGSEGTCGVILEATVDLVPLPDATLLIVLGHEGMTHAARAADHLRRGHPTSAGAARGGEPHITAMEGFDRRIAQVLAAQRGPAAVPALPRGDAWLLVEVAGSSPAALRAAASRIVADADALEHLVAEDPAHARALWRLREEGAGLASRAHATTAHAGWEDAAVPPEHLAEYLQGFDRLLEEHRLEAVQYGHFGDGCVHARITFPFGASGGREAFRAFVVEAARLVAGFGGSMSGEHGDGRARSEMLSHMYSPAALAAFRDFKAAFDPEGLCNPGVIVDPRPVDVDLRPLPRPFDERGMGLEYPNDGDSFAAAVSRCTGVGKCRSVSVGAGHVMCPSYVATGDEKDSTRGRARVLQEIVDGRLIEDGWHGDAVDEALDLCLACKGCLSDCPTGVDMATYKAEALFQRYRGRLRPRSHYTLGWFPRWARLASLAPRTASSLLRAEPFATIAKTFAGIDRRRRLPRFADTSFERWFARSARPTGGTAGTVLLWPDTFSNRLGPDVARAAVVVLEDAGYRVELPRPGLCCGLTWMSTGQLPAARRILRRTVDELAEAAHAGVPIVGLEPSCTAMFRHDAAALLGDDAAVRSVSAAFRTLAEVLAARRPEWSPPRLDGIRVIAQPHCHHHAVMGWQVDRALLAAAGADVVELGGCCGLAGNFGLERGHHDISVAVAEQQLLPALRADGGAVVLADGFSCRTQVEQLSDRSPVHLAELLASRLPRASLGALQPSGPSAR